MSEELIVLLWLGAVVEAEPERVKKALRGAPTAELQRVTRQVSHLADLIADVRAEKADPS